MTDLIASEQALIGPASEVTLHFSLILPSGEELDSTRSGKPATFTMGDGSLLPGFEACLLGKAAGYSEQVKLPASEAFGEHNPGNVQLLDKNRFNGLDEPLEPGLMVSFQAPDGELPGVVQEVYERTVKVDFNHPLSGMDIVFDVAILRVNNPD